MKLSSRGTLQVQSFLQDYPKNPPARFGLVGPVIEYFYRHGPLTGRVFAFSVNTHVKYYIEMACTVLKIKPKPAMSGDMAYMT